MVSDGRKRVPGVAFIEPAGEVPGAAPTVWVSERAPHEIVVPAKAGLIETFGNRTYLTVGDGAPVALDLGSGDVHPISGLYGEVPCGDDTSVFGAGDRKQSTLVEIPNK
jgi:hypothetical protein